MKIATLVNSAYRGEFSKQGWTTEADLLVALRTDTEEILQLILNDDSMFLLYKAEFETNLYVPFLICYRCRYRHLSSPLFLK